LFGVTETTNEVSPLPSVAATGATLTVKAGAVLAAETAVEDVSIATFLYPPFQ
jgi:hypothetical protein